MDKSQVTNDKNPFADCDTLTALVKQRLRINFWLASIAIVAALNIPIIVAALTSGFWSDKGGVIGLSHDYAWWIYQFLSVPATVIFFLWLPDGTCGVLEGLKGNKTLILSEPRGRIAVDYSRFVQRFARSYSHWAWIVLSQCKRITSDFRMGTRQPDGRMV
jgi:hypothetical protein